MPAEQAHRKLTTILVSDVVGYSRLAGADEELTLARLRALRSDLIDPIISVHHGRIVKRTGDGSLLEFRSVVDAVRCAIEVQTGMVERNAGLPPERRIEFRIGIHLGDVVEESDGDLMGDGVNIAARLEAICTPNGVCLSEDAYRQVRSRLDLAVTDLGDRELKNISEPVHVYSLQVGVPARAKPATQSTPIVSVAPKKRSMLRPFVAGITVLLILIVGGAWYFAVVPQWAPPVAVNAPVPAEAAHLSIVVLPFANLSNDPKQDYFADGITENLTTDLSRIRSSFVIARNTAFTYKGKNVDAKEIGKELGVRYVLEGSVQRDGNRVRVNAQLIDAGSGAHLWADRFEEDVADLFKLQDQVVARLANSLRVELVNAESQHPRPQNPDAVDLTMRGWALLWRKPTRETDRAARELFERAFRLDPTDAEAYSGIAYSHARDFINGWTESRADYTELVIGPADRALTIDPSNGMAAFAKGLYLYQIGHANDAKAIAEAALQRNPNLAPLYILVSLAQTSLGNYDRAISAAEQAIRLSPKDVQLGIWEMELGRPNLGLGHYSATIDDEHRAIDDDFNNYQSHELLAAAYALSGQGKEAKDELAEAMRLNPKLVTVKSLPPFDRQLPRIVEGLRMAGLPEDEGPKHLSIVVLPFQNLSGDPKQDYFADGITENLTTDLSRIRNSFVIARNTAFTYKGKNVDAKEIGKDLGVRYVLEGSVQRDGNRVRVNAQLIDAESGSHLWADRFEEDLADLFKLQDQVVARLANQLDSELIAAAALHAAKALNPDTIDFYLQGMARFNLGGPTNLKDARGFFERALALDRGNVDALVGMASVDAMIGSRFFTEDRAARLASAEEVLAKVLSRAPEYALAHMWLGVVQIYTNRAAQGIAECERALALDQNLADAHAYIGFGKYASGHGEEAEAHVREALRLSPRDTTAYSWMTIAGSVKEGLGADEEAVAWLHRAIEANRNFPLSHLFLASALAQLGRLDEARAEARAGLALDPTFTIRRFRAGPSSDNPRYLAQHERLAEGMRKAGIPEG